MTHLQFFKQLVETEEPLEELFQQLEDKSYPAIEKFIKNKVETDDMYADDRKESSAKPIAYERVEIVLMIVVQNLPFELKTIQGFQKVFESLRKENDVTNKKKNGSPTAV